MKAKDYQLAISPENFDSTVISAYLEDSYIQRRIFINLHQDNNYGFSIINTPAAYAANRFKIVIKRKGNESVIKEDNKLAQQINTPAGEGSISLFQNPVINNTLKLKLAAKTKGNFSLVIFNAEGKQIITKQFAHDGIDGIKNIPVKKFLPKGLLTATIKDAKGNSTSFNILVQ